MQTQDEFLQSRLRGIGGTDIAAILGLSQFKSPVDVYLEKTGKTKPKPSTLQMRYGKFYEEFGAQEYELKTGRKVMRYTKQLVHPQHDFLVGYIDRLVIPEGEKIAHLRGEIRTNRGMEAKCVSAFAGGEWGDDESDDVPPAYYVQSQWYMGLTGCIFWDLAALIGNHRFEIYPFHKDDESIALFQARAIEFWNNHVLKGVPPPPRSEEDVIALFPKSEEGRRAVANEQIIDMVERIKHERAEVENAVNRLEAARLPVKAFMAQAESLITETNPTKPLVTWKSPKDRIKTDFEKAFEELVRKCEIYKVVPAIELYAMKKEILAKYSEVVTGSRTFLIK